MLRDVSSRDVDAANAVGQGKAFVDGHGMADAVARVENDAGGAAGGVEGEDCLDGGEEGGNVEGLKEDLGGVGAVTPGVERGLGEEDGVLLPKVVSSLST